MYAEGLVTTNTVGLKGDQVRDEFAKGKRRDDVDRPVGPAPPIRRRHPRSTWRWCRSPARPTADAVPGRCGQPGLCHQRAVGEQGGRRGVLDLSRLEGGREQPARRSRAPSPSPPTSSPTLDAALDPIVPDVRAGNIYLPQIAWKRSEDILNVEATAQIQQMVQGKVTPEQVAAALDTKLSSLMTTQTPGSGGSTTPTVPGGVESLTVPSPAISAPVAWPRRRRRERRGRPRRRLGLTAGETSPPPSCSWCRSSRCSSCCS